MLTEALRRWAVYRLADALIGDTLGEYERSRVPEVIRSAGERFARVTGGRYPSLHALEGGRLRVATGEDSVLDAGDLSRGAQEQLYLVVRLGLVDSFARQSESLPLVLDDVLVNADPERQEGLITALVDAAHDHQTVVLTCHPETSAAIRRLASGAQVVRLERITEPARTAASSRVVDPAAASVGSLRPRAPERQPRAPDAELPAIAIAALQASADGLGIGQLSEVLGIPPGEVRELLRPLLASGDVVREGRTRGAKYRLRDGRTV